MATDATSLVSYYLVLPVSARNHLAGIRHWSHIKLGEDAGFLWLKGFSEAEIHSVEVLSIPYKELYQEVGPKLHKLGSQLPERPLPAVLWTPINRALPVEISNYNHNFFGVQGRLQLQLVPAQEEATVVAQWVALTSLAAYIEQAPDMRLKPIEWLIVGGDALLMGTPLLPLNGQSYYKSGSFLMPAGCSWNPALLAAALSQKMDPEKQYWTVVKMDGSYFQAKRSYFKRLSLSSFRNSLRAIKQDA